MKTLSTTGIGKTILYSTLLVLIFKININATISPDALKIYNDIKNKKVKSQFLILNKLNWKNKNISSYKPKISKIDRQKQLFYKKANKFKSFSYKKHSKNLLFNLYIPDRIKKNEKVPLIIYLHGSNSRGKDNILPTFESIRYFTYDKFQNKNKSFVLVPQCPNKQAWNGNTLKTFLNLVSEVKSKLPFLDKRRIYLIGHSMGAYGVCAAIKEKPNYFTAAMPISGAVSSYNYNFTNTPRMWIIYSKNDCKSVKLSCQKLYSKFTRHHEGKYKISNVSFTDHNTIFKRAIHDKKVINWLFSNNNRTF